MDAEGNAAYPSLCSSSTMQAGVVPAPIRKRRFSSAKIQPTRVKKVMQSDEEIGRMVASVPVAIGRAMEHFAEKLLEAAATCVHYSTSRTLSPAHMKQAMMQYPHFQFLEPLMRDIQLPTRASGEVVWHPEQIQQVQQFQHMQFQQAQLQQAQLQQAQLQQAQLQQAQMQQAQAAATSNPMMLPGPSDYVVDLFGVQMGSVPTVQQQSVSSLPQQPVIHSVNQQAANTIGCKRKQNNGNSEPPADGKPKRGRPRKIKKEDKCVDEEGILGEIKKPVLHRTDSKPANGFPLSDSELMPPPSMLPLRIARASQSNNLLDGTPQTQWTHNLPLLPQTSSTPGNSLSTASDQAC